VTTLALVSISCGDSGSPPTNPDPSPGGERITGNERLGWNQSAPSSGELASFRYVAYVDGTRVELADVACGGLNGSVYPCNSRMPAMSPGSHTIELASYVTDNGAVLESPRSAPLRVTVTGLTNAGAEPALTSTLLATADGVSLRVATLLGEVSSPTALAVAPDGRLFVAERAGRVRVFANGALLEPPAATIHESLVTASGDGGLLALALDADFERTHFVYVAYTVTASEGVRHVRVVRFREVAGRLGERIVLIDQIPAAPRPAVAIVAGPDGRIYVALDASPAGGRTAALASFSGKVLRLTTDGKTPDDQPGRSPVIATDVLSPRGLDWHLPTSTLWLIDAKRADAEELRLVGSGNGSVPAGARVPLPPGTGASALAFYRGANVPALEGNLFIAAEEGRYLLRLRLDARSQVVSTERLLHDAARPIRAVASGAGGLVYVATDRAILRLGPD
jgi:glucose/arabinose dehydrogenase